MNQEKWRKQVALVILAFFVLGFILGGVTFSSGDEKKQQTACTNRKDVEALKAIDDEGFAYAAEFADTTSLMFQAAALQEVDVLTAGTQKINGLTEKIDALTVRREAVLKRLCL